MKRYILFAGDKYYPEGGAKDIKGSFDSHQDAITYLLTIEFDWANVLDTKTSIIYRHSTFSKQNK